MRAPVSGAWQLRAACRDADPELFFPISDKQRDVIEQSRTYCRVCPVRARCLQVALGSGEAHGTWGGLTEWERLAVLRRRHHPGAAAVESVATAQGHLEAAAAAAEQVGWHLERAQSAISRQGYEVVEP
jgi:WhiB family transcriptional regulator, redox-sensing transcriptional regulator